MNSKSGNLTLKSVEKLIQIGRVSGNVNIQGNIEKAFFSVGDDLLDAMRKSAKPEESLTDLIVKTADKFDGGKLISFDVGAKILFLLMIHPEPIIALDILSSRRPKADIFTLFWLAPSFLLFEAENNIFKSFGYNRNERIEEVNRAFFATKAFKQGNAEAFTDEMILKIAKGFMEARSSNGMAEYSYVLSHPEVFSMSVDSLHAKMCAEAFIKKDYKALEHFMEIRQNFSSRRPGG